MSKIHKAIYCIVGILFCSIVIPLFLDHFIWANNIPSSISNSDWSSFLGSFLGGIIGGVGTLAAVYITTLETRKIQEDSEKRNKDEQIKKYYKEKFWHFSEQLAIYNMNLEMIKEDLYRLLNEYKKYYANELNIKAIKRDIEKVEGDIQIKKLQNEERAKQNLLRENREIIIRIKDNIVKKFNELKCSYLIFTIVLSDLPDSDVFMEYIKKIEKLLKDIINNNFEINNESEDYLNLISELDLFENKCSFLIKAYEKIII